MNGIGFLVPLLLSVVAGIIIGYLNQRGNGIGGARTFAIICCGSTLVTLVSRYFFLGLGKPWFADPGRISAQIIPALVFLAFGVLWFAEARSDGVSAGTNLWLAALVGMMLGSGFGRRSIIAFGFVILVYLVLDKVERMIQTRRSTPEKPPKKAES